MKKIDYLFYLWFEIIIFMSKDKVRGILCQQFITIRNKYNNYENEVAATEKIITNIEKLKLKKGVLLNILNNKLQEIRTKLSKIKENNQYLYDYMIILSKQSRFIKHKYMKTKQTTKTPIKTRNKNYNKNAKNKKISNKQSFEYKTEPDLLDFLYCYNSDIDCNLNQIFQ